MPAAEWPPELLHLQTELRRLYYRNPRYESSWYGALVAVLAFMFPSAAPFLFALRPQDVLRGTTGPALLIDDAEEVVKIEEAETSATFDDPELPNDAGEPVLDPDASFVSYSYPIQGRAQERQPELRTSDFVLDQRSGTGGRRPMALIEVKATAHLSNEDLEQFIRRTVRLSNIHEAGLNLQNILMMLIAGGQVYTRNFDE